MRVVWTPAALSDLDEIQDYIAQDSPVSAYRVIVELTTRTRTNLGDFPLMGRLGRARGSANWSFPTFLTSSHTGSRQIAWRSWP